MASRIQGSKHFPQKRSAVQEQVHQAKRSWTEPAVWIQPLAAHGTGGSWCRMAWESLVEAVP